MVDIDKLELDRREVPVDKLILGDVKDVLTAILNKNIQDDMDRNEWLTYCSEMKAKYPVVTDEFKNEKEINSYYFTERLSHFTESGTTIVVDTGSVCNVVSQTWNLKKGQRYLISGGLSCMGFWASSIGAAKVSTSVVAITGDGSAQMNIQELATLRYNNLPIKLFIYNNSGYMLIRHNQHNYMSDRFLGVGPDSGLETPNFSEIAKAYGIKGVRIEKKEDIEEKLKEVFRSDEPVVCEIIMPQFGKIEPRIASRVMPDGSLKAAEFDDLYPFLDK